MYIAYEVAVEFILSVELKLASHTELIVPLPTATYSYNTQHGEDD